MQKLTCCALSFTADAAALVNSNSEVPFEELWSVKDSPLFKFSLITTLSLKFWPKTNPVEDVPVVDWTGAGTDVAVLGATLPDPRGTNFGASTSFVSFTLASADVAGSLSFSTLAPSGLVAFKKGLFVGFSCGGRRTDPEIL